MMRGSVRFCCFLILVQIVRWVGVTSCRPFAPIDGHGAPIDGHGAPQPDPEQSRRSLQDALSSKEGYGRVAAEAEGDMNRLEESCYNNNNNKRGEGEGGGVEKKIGSRPPSCEHKCFGCTPCQPVQVPTAGLQYANYEPEGWKCKCGPSFFTP